MACLLAFYWLRLSSFFIAGTVSGENTALGLRHCCAWLPSEDFLELLTIILPSLVNIYVLALFFGRELTFKSSRFIIITPCAEVLSYLLSMILLR